MEHILLNSIINQNLLGSENFFSEFLKPIAKYLNSYFAELTDLFFKKNDIHSSNHLFNESWCSLADVVLKKTSKGMISKVDYEFLQSLSDFKEDHEILSSLVEKGFSTQSTLELLTIAKNRKNGDYLNGWRKGFAYTLTLNEENSKTILKITPGAYLGPAGVVESLGIVLKRPEDKTLPTKKLVEISKKLHKWGDDFPISVLNSK